MKTHFTRFGAAAMLAVISLAIIVPLSYADDVDPTASFSITPSNPVVGEQVTFTSTSTDAAGSIRRQYWDLDNDGSYDDGTGVTATRTFKSARNYTVRLAVIDDEGDWDTVQRTFTVAANGAPTASFTAPSEVDTGEAVNLASTSTDPEGRPLAHAWDLDNDGGYDDGTATTATTSFSNDGTRTVRLRVTDSGGIVRTASRTITVRNRLPVAAFNVSATEADTGQSITFSSTSSDPDGSIAQHRWDFDGNGTTDATGATVSRSFADDGTVTVTLTVVDDDGGTRTTSRAVTIRNRAPVAAFNVSSAAVDTGQAVSFTSTSSDPDGSIAQHRWDFDGNGTTDATGATVSRSFADDGTFNVTLTVVDDDGATRTATRTVTVRNRAPVAGFNLSAAAVDTGEAIAFTSTATDPDGTVAAHSWDFDDDGSADATGPTASHSYPDDGTFEVTLTVTDDDGATRTASRSVTVRNRAPSAGFTYAPAAPVAGDSVQLTSTAADPDGTIAAQRWDLDNDGVFDDATGTTAARTFTAEGSYQVGHQSVDDDGAVTARFETIEVAARPADPAPDPGPPAGAGTGTGSTAPAQGTATAVIAPRLLSPFPRVRITGITTRRGVRIDTLSVRTPGATRILVVCKGKGCPYSRKVVLARFSAGRVRVVKLPGFKRRYVRAGALIQVYVTRPNAYGKYTRFLVRGKLKPPKRLDRCTAAGAARVRRCGT